MSWFLDKLTGLSQYAQGQANAVYQMLVDPAGAPLATSAGALNTFETAAMGFDPSIGRTPVEQSNNSSFLVLTNSTVSVVVKAAPGFVHALNLTVVGANAAATHLALYDNIVASGSPLHIVPLPAAGAVSPTIVLDALFTVGLSVIPVTVSAAGVATAAASLTGMAILLNISYR